MEHGFNYQIPFYTDVTLAHVTAYTFNEKELHEVASLLGRRYYNIEITVHRNDNNSGTSTLSVSGHVCKINGAHGWTVLKVGKRVVPVGVTIDTLNHKLWISNPVLDASGIRFHGLGIEQANEFLVPVPVPDTCWKTDVPTAKETNADTPSNESYLRRIRVFTYGNHVMIASDLGLNKNNKPGGVEGIVLGSQFERTTPNAAHRKRDRYAVYVKDVGEITWYHAKRLTLIADDARELLRSWRQKARDLESRKSEPEWIFSQGVEILREPSVRTIVALAKQYGITNLYGVRGPQAAEDGNNFTYNKNKELIIELVEPFLREKDLKGWCAFCKAHKARVSRNRRGLGQSVVEATGVYVVDTGKTERIDMDMLGL